MKPEEIIQEVAETTSQPIDILNVHERDARDQRLTHLLVLMAELEAQFEQEAARIVIREAKTHSVAASEASRNASDEWMRYMTLRRLREALIEHLRGLRAHSRREYL